MIRMDTPIMISTCASAMRLNIEKKCTVSPKNDKILGVSHQVSGFRCQEKETKKRNLNTETCFRVFPLKWRSPQ